MKEDQRSNMEKAGPAAASPFTVLGGSRKIPMGGWDQTDVCKLRESNPRSKLWGYREKCSWDGAESRTMTVLGCKCSSS